VFTEYLPIAPGEVLASSVVSKAGSAGKPQGYRTGACGCNPGGLETNLLFFVV